MKTKHTPAPWGLYRNGRSVGASDASSICEIWERGGEDGKANANLIAAAPELLEAVKLFQQFFDEMPKGQFGKISCDIGLMNDAFIASNKAIAKAEGK